MLHKNLKTLRRSISEKFLGKQIQKSETIPRQNECSIQDEEDPYREILRNNNDNVSHLVFHGSSLKSMSSIDFSSSSSRSKIQKVDENSPVVPQENNVTFQ